ncbi:GNAT family N-acetyltransferase [Terribacillus saccharophilus]|uniref:N-acetyltransferase domain-containing protein n=1 Tax=Terribacillus saccharophilus TaxID=361277 RepID=A0ABX4H3N5_9BACI|nr:GNAT family N-acetyltransferase [Terribacillus saccharophilus]PAD34183.1 hypothetical protein CHH56_16035 [Terribacillus saccharophilus]PAD98067.1 hypothetical protein CHH50_00395 [Terribacillus saccharophilus]PAE01709.1 hypothetical protein CHH48_00395 [Terribacillus saccharophilus]
MKDSKRLVRILDEAHQSASPITCSAFLGFYLKDSGIIQKAVHDYLVQTNTEVALMDSLNRLDERSNVTLYNSYLLSDNLYKAIEFGAARAEKFNQVIMTDAHVLEGILSFLPDTDKWLDILQLTSSTHDLLVTLPISRVPMTPVTDIKAASLIDKKEILDFVKEHFSLRWTEQVQRLLIEDNGIVLIVREESRLAGFCCYQKQNAKRAVFGPMGVRKDSRDSSYGRSLLLSALHDATENGFRELLISEAGPIEFYERVLPLQLHTKEKG